MKKTKIIFMGIGLLVISYGYYFLNSIFGFSIPCLFHFLTGLYCPGCGITRMIFAILKFDFYQAFRFNPLLFLLGIIYILFLSIKTIVKIKNNFDIKISNKVYYFLILILIIYGVIRNIPFFEFLKPTII